MKTPLKFDEIQIGEFYMVWDPPGERWRSIKQEFGIEGFAPKNFKEAVGHNYKAVDKDPAVVRQKPYWGSYLSKPEPIEYYAPRAEVLLKGFGWIPVGLLVEA